jgi:TPR repeat protein
MLKRLVMAYFCMGLFLSMPVLADEVLDELQTMATAGDMVAQYQLGEHYLLGKGVEKDSITAIKWLERAAEQNYLNAAEMLGQVYMSGLGVPTDSKKAFKWLQIASDIATAQGEDSEC